MICNCTFTNEKPPRIKQEAFIGQTKTIEYRTWARVKQRCFNPKTAFYDDYGGRGIGICTQWANSFISFIEDMGKRPSGHTIERINVNAGYCPHNCKWANVYEQAVNRRKRYDFGIRFLNNKWTVTLSINGKTVYVGKYKEKETAILERNKVYYEWYGVYP